MKITEMFGAKALLSFEVFPPRTERGMTRLCGPGGVLDQLYALDPAYISCTYGAGGTNETRTIAFFI